MLIRCNDAHMPWVTCIVLFCGFVTAESRCEEQQLLRDAIKSGNEKSLKDILAQIKHPVDSIQLNDMPLLIFAVRQGHEKAANILMEYGLNTGVRDADGNTALHWACRLSKDKVAQSLFNKGAALDVLNANGKTPLHLAVACNAPRVLRALFGAGANLNVKDVRLRSPLFELAAEDSVEMAELLIKLGVDPAAPDDDGLLPVHVYASSDKSLAVVKALLAKLPESVNAKDRWGQSPVFWAVFMNQEKVARQLIESKAKLNFSNLQGETVLHVAARMAGSEMIELLVQNGAALEDRNRQDQTPLHVAVNLFRYWNVEALVKAGANIKAMHKGRDVVATAEHISVETTDRLYRDKCETVRILKQTQDRQPKGVSKPSSVKKSELPVP